MTEKDIILEIERYLTDTSYNYAVMIDGEWGCGKTYFVKNGLTKSIDSKEQKAKKPRKVVYISLYGYKTILDIQDAIVVQLHIQADKKNKTFLGKLGKTQVVGNGMQSALALAKAARDVLAPGASIFDLEGIWRDLTAYIFIFDDVERCDCPLNEVFGLINGLVEHDGVKVILVANEKEIQIKEAIDSREIQYLVALNENIEYPKVKDFWGDKYEKSRLTAEELERRRKILFPSSPVDEEFKKLREKLIGITMHFQPNMMTICSEMIHNSALSSEDKEKLCCNLESFYATMTEAGHLNLRTFQFFLSRLKAVMDSLSSLSISPKYYEEVSNKLISDCFISAIDFKANLQPPEDRIARITFDLSREKCSKAVDQYVRTGELRLELLQNEIDRFIDENVINLIPNNDPYKLLLNEYYLHTQTWCEERIGEIQKKLDHNEYPPFTYGEIIRPFLILESLGFDEYYLDRVKAQMIVNISKTDHPVKPANQLYYFEDVPEIYNRAKKVLSEIKDAVDEHYSSEQEIIIEEILKRSDWANCLVAYVEHSKIHENPNSTVFSNVDSDVLVKKLNDASPETVWNFRRLFHTLYSTNVIQENKPSDLVVFETVVKNVDLDKVDDLVLKFHFKLLINDVEKVCSQYSVNN